MKHKISLNINIALLLMIAASFLFGIETLGHKILLSIGLLGLSGSLTNSLAIHMLFERVPFIYGSGIIALNFREIKQDLEELMVQQFFNRQQIEHFLAEEFESGDIDWTKLDDLLDFAMLFEKFKDGLAQSFAGNPLGMMALPLLESNRDKIIEAIRSAMDSQLRQPEFQNKVKGLLEKGLSGQQLAAHEQFEQRVRSLIRQRLDEMSPKMVKEVIQHMMESKLIWLVVWGALFGALMGLVSALLRYFLVF